MSARPITSKAPVDAAPGEVAHAPRAVLARRRPRPRRSRPARAPARASPAVAIDRDDPPRAGELGGRDDLQPDAAAADHRDAVAEAHAGGVAHRARAGDDAATQERGLPQRDVGPQRDRARAGDDSPLARNTRSSGRAGASRRRRRADARCRPSACRAAHCAPPARRGCAAPRGRSGTARTTGRTRTPPGRPGRRGSPARRPPRRRPAPSWPSTIGQRPGPSTPSARCTSEWQTPAAATRTSTSSAFGASSSTSSTATGVPGSRSTTALDPHPTLHCSSASKSGTTPSPGPAGGAMKPSASISTAAGSSQSRRAAGSPGGS